MRPFIRNRAQLGRLFDVTSAKDGSSLSRDNTQGKFVGGDARAVLSAEVELTPAEVLDLNTTPIEIVPAPGAWKAIVVIQALASVDFDSAAYETNTTLQLLTDNATNAQFVNTNLLAATDDSIWLFESVTSNTLQVVEDEPLEVTVATGDPATGDSPIKVKVFYCIVDL